MTVSYLTGLGAFTLQTAQVTGGNPETVVADATAMAPVGALIKFNGNLYRYVQYSTGASGSATAGSVGAVAYWKTLTPASTAAGASPSLIVTCDASSALGGSGAAAGNMVAGIVKGPVTTLYYTWIQVGGVATCQTTAATAAGDWVSGQTSANLQMLRYAAGSALANTASFNIVGIALDTRNATTTSNSILLQNLIW